MSWIRRNLRIILPLGAVVLAGVAYLAFGVFGVHTLFFDDTVDEAGPVFDSGLSTGADETLAPTVPETVAADETITAMVDVTPTDPNSTEPIAPDSADAPVATAPPTPQIVTIADGSFIPRGRYSGEGDALVLNDGTDQRFVRFENFSTDNGPDLRVYLSASDANADGGTFDDDFIDLGVLKGNIGDQNYEIPVGVDLGIYDTVVVWCVRFSTPFTAADLVPT